MRQAFALLLALAGFAGAQEKPAAAPAPVEWTFFYWMAYDNNLQPNGPPILKMLKAGLSSPKLTMACWADFRDREGMFRYVIRGGAEKPEVEALDREGSAEEETVAEALEWTRQNAPARKYALIFLDHGGGLSEMCADEHPGKRGGQKWLFLPHVADVVRAFREKVRTAGSEVELVFLQQCGKGALENYDCFRGATKYVMGSETVVGAPNRYYEKALGWMGEHPEADGLALARQITECETPDMFTNYATVSTGALEALPQKLSPVLRPLLDLETLRAPTGLEPCFDLATGAPPELAQKIEAEKFHDGLAWLEALYAANALDRAPLAAFSEWVKKELVVVHRVSPRKTELAGSWCGISLYTPYTGKLLARYRKHYPIYARTELDELLERLVPLTVPASQKREEKKPEPQKK